jgi:hypothetical protein
MSKVLKPSLKKGIKNVEPKPKFKKTHSTLDTGRYKNIKIHSEVQEL